MKLLKKWSFLLILVASGTVFLVVTNSFEAVSGPLLKAQAWVLRVSGGQDGEEDPAHGVSQGDIPPSGVSQADDPSGNPASQAGTGEDWDPVSGNHSDGEGQTSVPGEGSQEGAGESEDAGGESWQETQPGPLETGAAGQEEPPVTTRSPEEVTYTTVEDDYFSDAVFIGDSRTVGMFEYGGLEDITTFYASTGLTVFKMFDSPIVTVPGQKDKITVEQALSERQFSKIYLMIGINEMGRGTVETFMEKYKEVLAHLQELQPDAIIYLQGIMKVTTERSNKGDYINNPGIDARNAEIARLADYVRVYYLDVNPLICDETGGMEPSYTFDGVHLKAQYIPIWKDFLKQHAVVLD